MFAIVQNNQIVMLVQDGTAFEYNGVQYPQNWTNLSTPEEKAQIGMVDVVYAPMPNQQYYWVTQTEPVYNESTNQVDIGFTATPKDLTQLKANLVAQTNQTAYSILLPSDWMVVKAVETSTAIDPAWNTWRAEIRTQAKAGVTAIEGCTSVEQLEALPAIQWAHDPNYVPPVEVTEETVEA